MSSESETCRRYNSYNVQNRTFFILSNKYEGIPQNFGINIGSYFILLLIFILLRKTAWNYGKLAWLNRPKQPLSTLHGRDSQQEDFNDIDCTSDDKPLNGNKFQSFRERIMNKMPLFIKMSDEQMRQRCGPDAVIYCQFQRCLMIIVFVMMFFSLTIIFPCNLTGKVYGNITVFGGATIGNLDPKSPLLWAHFTISMSMMLFAFFVSSCFLKSIDVKTSTEFSSTIMITDIPIEWCDELSIQTHFHNAFPSVKVQKVQVVQRVDKLIHIDAQKNAAEDALNYCYKELDNGHEQVMVIPSCCGRRLACDCCRSKNCVPVEGVYYYEAEVIRLSNMFIAEKSVVVHGPKLPIVFVTFENVKQALLVRRDYIYQNYWCVKKPPSFSSNLSTDMNSSNWKVVFAPMVDDILWQNLHKHGWKLWTVILLINAVVAVLVITLSTPAMIVNLISKFNIVNSTSKVFLDEPKMSALISQFLPSLILVLITSLMPMLIYWSDQLSGHWTKSSQNKAVMNKLYTVLLFTVLILPSMGFMSVEELVKWIFTLKANHTDQFRWDCIFLPDGGAIFCNYMITASFIGTALELLRFGELFIFACRMMFSKSRAEDKTIAKKVVWEFQFGLAYAWTLCLFTVTSAYSVIVPIITPFGLTYLILKHLVDRYNLIHVNSYSLVHKSVHTNGTQLMQIGLILTQATVLIFITIRQGSVTTISICCILAFVFGLLLTFGRTTRRWIEDLSFMKYALSKPLTCDVANEGDMLSGVVAVEDDDFIVLEDVNKTKNTFLPTQLLTDSSGDIEEILSRRLRDSRLSLAGSIGHLSSTRSYGSQ